MLRSYFRKLSAVGDDDIVNAVETSSFQHTLWLNIGIFCVLIVIFEINKNLKSVYFKRLTRHFKVFNPHLSFCQVIISIPMFLTENRSRASNSPLVPSSMDV